MSDRKPPGVRWESWIDKQIRDAEERGEFDDLSGKGRPLPGIDRPHDELWWVKEKLRRENLSFLPPALAIRKEVEAALEHVERARSEEEVRAIVADINTRISDVNAHTTKGPPTRVAPLDVERIVAAWRAARDDDQGAGA